MNDAIEKQLQDAVQEAASLKNLREKFLLLAETGDCTAMAHVRELEQREQQARARICDLHIQRLPVA